jgi:DNA-binding CsgD family transcriptional regulator
MRRCAGASGFLLRSGRPQELVAAVRAAVVGDTLLAPPITRRLVEAFVHRPPPGTSTPPQLEELTPREVEVLRHIAGGQSNAEIARELFVSEDTVKTHASRIFMKLGLRDRTQSGHLRLRKRAHRTRDAHAHMSRPRKPDRNAAADDKGTTHREAGRWHRVRRSCSTARRHTISLTGEAQDQGGHALVTRSRDRRIPPPASA